MAVLATGRPAGTPRPDLPLVNYRPKRAQGNLTATSTQVLQAAAGGTIVVDTIFVTERAGTASQTFTIRFEPTGATDNNLLDLFSGVAIKPNETVEIMGPIHLTDRDSLFMFAALATSLNYLICYRQEI